MKSQKIDNTVGDRILIWLAQKILIFINWLLKKLNYDEITKNR